MTYLEGGRYVRAEAVKQGMERLRLPGERPPFIAAESEHSPALEDKIGTELTAGKSDQVFPEAVREDALRWTRGKSLWAGGIALGVVLLGLALLFYLGERDRTSEASIEKVKQEGSTTQVEMKPSKELGAGGAATSSPSEPTLLQGVTKVPGSSAERKASSGSAKAKPSRKASAQAATRESGKAASPESSVVPPSQTLTEFLREENLSREIKKGLVERREPPLGDRQQGKTQSPGPTPGSSVRETSEKETEEVEPGIVIDWLLEKREKK
jgi:hypothetical protein